MLEKYNDPIEVLVRFNKKKVEPAVFKWKGRVYNIEKVNLVHRQKQGDDKIYYFSVSDAANFFRLAFHTRDLSWRIEEVYYD